MCAGSGCVVWLITICYKPVQHQYVLPSSLTSTYHHTVHLSVGMSFSPHHMQSSICVCIKYMSSQTVTLWIGMFWFIWCIVTQWQCNGVLTALVDTNMMSSLHLWWVGHKITMRPFSWEGGETIYQTIYWGNTGKDDPCREHLFPLLPLALMKTNLQASF